MKKFIKRGTVLVTAAVLLTGCGEEMTALTESEEAVVVNYSAGTLAKHNIYQQEGMAAVYPKEEEEEDTASKPEETEETQEQKQENSGGNTEETSGTEEESAGQMTLTEALAVEEITFSYKDYSVSDSYKQGEYFSLDASSGNTYMILNINITNTGTEAAECDLLGRQPIFTLKLNGEAGVKNEITLLENDLSTYTGKIEPGQTVAAILLFEVPKKSVENISSLQMSLQMNEKTSDISLK